MKNRLFQRLSAFAVAGAMAVSFAAVPVAATEVPEHTHNWVSRVTKVATCQEPGFEERACDCGEVETKELPQKTEHTYNAEGKCSVCSAENPELLTQADPNANNAEGTQTGGEGGSQSGSTENKGDGTENKGDGTENEGDGTENKGGGTENEGDGTENKGDGTENKGDGTENKGDGAENKGDDAENKGDGAENKGDSTENKGDDAENKGDGTENKGDGTENKGDSTENKGDELTEEEKAAQESAKQVAEVQALIDALPDQIQSDEVAQYQEKVAAIRAILATMTAEQVAQLTGLEKLELELTTADAVEPPVAMVEGQEYTNFQKAFEAFNGATGNVTVYILKPVVFTDGMELTGKYDSITFVGEEGTDATITINQKAGGDYLESNKKVSFKNLTLNKENPSWADNSGHMGKFFSIQGGEVSYEGCTFPNGACTSSGIANYNNCHFYHTKDENDKGEYGLWVYTDAHVTVQDSTFYSAKGIKLYAEGRKRTSTLVVTGTTFTASVDEKPAVAISCAESVKLLGGNTYQNSTGVLELDSAPDANCNGIEFVFKDSAKITATDRSANNAPCGVVMGDNLYLNVKSAADAAAKDPKPNSKVAVLYDPANEGKVEFPAGTELTFPAGVSKPGNIVAEAQVGDVYYTTVQDAINAAAASGEKVVIGSDVALTEPLIIPAVGPVTLDLNGKTLSGEKDSFGGEGQPDSLIIVDNGSSLTVTGNGTIQSSVNGIKMTQKDTYDAAKPAKLVVENGTITAGDSYAIAGNGLRHNTDITINGGTISGKAGGIYHPQDGKLTINGGSITGGEFGVEMRAGNLNITGGSINAPLDKFEVKPNGNGSTSIGVAVAVVPHTTGKEVSVTISGGTLTGKRALNEEKKETNSGTVSMAVSGGNFKGEVASETVQKFISGGTFSAQPGKELVKDHFSFTQNGDKTFGVKEDPYIIDGDGNKDYIDPTNPDAPVSLDQMLKDNAPKNDAKITLGANAVVNDAHTMLGKLTMEVNGHKITGTGSISGELTLKDLNAKNTHLALPQGGKVTFQNGSVLVSADAVTNAAGNSVGYSKPIQITYGGHDYTYFLAIGGGNDGKLSIDANGKPIVSGQHYVVKAKTDKIEKFTMTGIYNGSVTSNDFYKNTNATLQFVTDALATALEVGFVTVDGKQITDSSCFSITSGDTAAVTLSNKYLRSLSVGVHTLHMNFLDGSTAFAVFSVRTTSNADSSNPKTGDTIFLPIAVMTLSLTALAVLMPRKKKFF